MNNRQQLIEALKRLPEDQLDNVATFVEFLVDRMRRKTEQLPVIE